MHVRVRFQWKFSEVKNLSLVFVSLRALCVSDCGVRVSSVQWKNNKEREKIGKIDKFQSSNWHTVYPCPAYRLPPRPRCLRPPKHPSAIAAFKTNPRRTTPPPIAPHISHQTTHPNATYNLAPRSDRPSMGTITAAKAAAAAAVFQSPCSPAPAASFPARSVRPDRRRAVSLSVSGNDRFDLTPYYYWWWKQRPYDPLVVVASTWWDNGKLWLTQAVLWLCLCWQFSENVGVFVIILLSFCVVENAPIIRPLIRWQWLVRHVFAKRSSLIVSQRKKSRHCRLIFPFVSNRPHNWPDQKAEPTHNDYPIPFVVFSSRSIKLAIPVREFL